MVQGLCKWCQVVVFCDGDTMDEQPDGTILIKNRKTYLQDEKGVSLGAAWYDEWIAPDGKVVRKSKPIPMSEMEKAP